MTLTATGTLTGRRLVVTGSDHEVDLTRLERELTTAPHPDIASLDPNGKPIVGATVTAEITELIPVRRLVGYDYDPITKLVVPRYEYDTERKSLRTLTLTTRGDGTFRLTLTVPNASHEYEVVLQTQDRAGRTAQSSLSASRAFAAQPSREPLFENTGKAGGPEFVYRIGDPIRLTMTDGVRALPTGGADRYFYLVSRQGRRSAYVTTTPRFSRTFGSADAPGIFIIGVHFNGRTYEPKAAVWATFDTRQRSLTVELSSGRPSYRPGDTVTLTVRTRDATGAAHPGDRDPAGRRREAVRDGRGPGRRPVGQPLRARREWDRPAHRHPPAADRGHRGRGRVDRRRWRAT